MAAQTADEWRKERDKNKAWDEDRKRRRSQQTYTSEHGLSGESSLEIQYCSACSQMAFVVSESLAKQPTRGSDDSIVVKPSLILKNMMNQGELKLIKRQKGVEKQHRWQCSGCELMLAYQSKPFDDESNKYIFVLGDATSPSKDVVGAAGEAKRDDKVHTETAT